ncbi:unnamed protein product [Polarella glacialis]|uniref:Uncharacterized protein n=1 Tax=Polarella glacialis TaxID=89957 RepID=A0A813FSG8_POLGL|nr:unnamed protein product [Polarella glacialis]|mmetsp:Transcript_40102/g.64863  ORF Transcript_40102/g.64863 Transcript_40102/m.64863 type:complete len:282 (-) Transcript_40102:336-1181(-)|eukprot:CAMPEP_0115082964 /NCGR_PEP_ID=MMETSP0227-20121206/20240_1 /TAXON_ID=89957 /ORGANISM="Polarella glacialis, Strain CCMP 1383" /LENGTH=281 /DNA_ID=CAMNT_0002471205 /DNA_START=72 /DNA_END=917 /DNA_ORIENTATION=-
MAAAPEDFVSKVVGAASQGAVGAFVAAILSAVAEPVVNNVLVNRVPVIAAFKELNLEKIKAFLRTTLATNFIKFPFFEATNVIMGGFDIPPALRGTVTGAVFCTTTLPITNYRFRKSMGLEITAGNLYQAYLPTVLRDILYGIVRNKMSLIMIGLNPNSVNTNLGRFVNTFTTIMAAAVLSAPGNELRGYCLQPPGRALSFGEFFQPSKFVRSTSVGALIMSVSLGVGTLATPQVQKLWAFLRDYMRANPVGYLLVILFALHQALESRRHQELTDKVETGK